MDVRTELAAHGFVHTRVPGCVAAASRDPWAFARSLVGDALTLVEVHPIAPHAGGRSFAASKRETPLHTDSQRHRGVPPYLQVMLCEQPAARGGESLLLDSWALLERIATEDPELFAALFERTRRLPFVFGDILGPTVALRGSALVFSHPPMPVDDDVGRRLRAWLDDAATHTRSLAPDDLLVVDNHRMLHGRRAFDDDRRRLLRLLIWTDARPPAPAAWIERATHVREHLAAALADEAVELREAIIGAEPGPRDPRLDIVLALLRGASPGKLAARHGVPEPELYRWRDAVLAGGLAQLATLDDEHELHAALARVQAKIG